MSFFGNDENSQVQDQPIEETQAEESLKIKIGADEYDQTEAERLLSLGKIAREAEERYNTKIDRVWPQYTRAQNDIQELRKEMETLKARAQQEVSQTGGIDPETARQAREAAEQLGLVTKDKFLDYMSSTGKEYLDTWYQQRRAEENLMADLDRHSKELDGTDGRPRFDAQEIVYYMRDHGHNDPMRAYKEKYEKELDNWRVKQIIEGQKTGFYSGGRGTTAKTPSDRVPKDPTDLKGALAEILSLGE